MTARRGTLLLGMAWWLLAGCGESAPAAPSGLVLRPGAGFFERLDAVRVDQHPRSSVPDKLRELVRQALAQRRLSIPPSAWERVEDGDLWRVRPALRPDLELGRVVLTHEGREPRADTESWRRRDNAPGDRRWIDVAGETRLSWSAADGVLTARRSRPPGPVVIAYAFGAGGVLDRLEERLCQDLPIPRTASALTCRATLGTEDRACLLAPAPTTLTLDVDELAGDALRVAVGLADVSFAAVDGRLVRAPGKSDGVTFAVDVVSDGDVVTRAWSEHVDTFDAFREVSVDLSAWEGQAVRLRLVTERGPAGEASFDYALWAGLRLSGDVSGPPDRPHVVLIDVDTQRADRLGCYGYERPTSPRLDAWAAARAERFTDASSTSNWTLPSTVSMLTGLAISQYPVLRFPQALGPEAEPLAMRLAAAGYETYARTEAGFVGATFGFNLGFELFDFRQRGWKVHQKIGWSEELQRLAGRRSGRPVFYFLHTYQVHEPYRDDRRFDDPENPYSGPWAAEVASPKGLTAKDQIDGKPPTEADRRFVDALYDAGVRRMDDVVGAFLEELPAIFGDEPYLVILTSDHGEELLDHGHFGHGKTLYREQLHVPLLIEHPAGGRTGVSDVPVTTLDIVPTILDYAGLDEPAHLPGHSLRELPTGPRLSVAQHAATAHAISFNGYKAVLGEIAAFGAITPVSQLFRRDVDPGETHNLVETEPQVFQRLQRLHERFLQEYPLLEAGGPAETSVGDDVVEGLQALGYLGEDEGEGRVGDR